MVPLPISAENLRRLSVLTLWSNLAFEEFESQLDASRSSLRTRRAIHAAFEDAKHLSESEATDVLQAVMPLLVQFVGAGTSPIEVARAVVDGIRQNQERATLKADEELGKLQERLFRVLSNESLLLKGKATELAYERGSILTKTRVLSDLRPVFGGKDVVSIDALTVIHTLVISFMEDQKQRKLHLALDTADLEALKSVVERALEKQRALDAFATASSVRKFDIV